MRCSYCRYEGHNKTTCEAQTEYLRKRALNTDSEYWRSRYEERIAPRGRKMSSKRCGYCRDLGHTRRSCPSLVEDRKWYTQFHNESVDILHSYLERSHIGIGSLFKVRLTEWDDDRIRYFDSLHLLVSLEMPDNLLTTTLQPHMVLREISSKGHQIRKTLRPLVVTGRDPSYSRKAVLISPSRQDLPNDWAISKKISFEDTKHHKLFTRTGCKEDDKRNHVFIQMSNCRCILQQDAAEMEQSLSMKRKMRGAERFIDEWSTSSRLSSMMSDYKNQINTNV